MKKMNFNRLFNVIFFCVLSIYLLNNEGYPQIEKFSKEELVNKANSIVIGTITHIESQWNPEKTRIYTYVIVAVESNIKGINDHSITIKIPGGKVGEIFEEVSDVPEFHLGEKTLLFLQSGDCPIVGGYQGKFTIRENKIAGLNISLYEFVNEIRTSLRKYSPETFMKKKGSTESSIIPEKSSPDVAFNSFI